MAERKEVQQDVHLDERIYGVWISPFPKEGYVNVYGRDITERKLAEEELLRSEQRLNRAQEIAHLGSWELDLVNNRLTWSDEVYRIFGLQPQEFGATYEAFLEAVHPEDRASVDAAYSGSLREGRDTYEIEHRVIRKSAGEIRIVQERCDHIRDASGRIIRSIGMVHDVTERKQAEEALRQRTSELQHLTKTLEQQVLERTEELEVANEELRHEVDECQRIETDLRKSQTSLQHLSIELLNAQEKERKLVAGEIHDSIGSSLSAIKFKVETTLAEVSKKSPETATALQNIIPIVQGAIDEARRIQMNLRPSILDDLGILATIKWFCRQFESTYSRIRISQNINIQEREVPDALKTVIFRVLQEGLNNIAKHSNAKMVMLLLRKTGQGVQLVIRDNGEGFDVSKAQFSNGAAHGLGLKNMRERTEVAGGSLVIESTRGKGTTIRASWPV
jgi:PAS domain S-box-containing protein